MLHNKIFSHAEIGISEDHRKISADILGKMLADESVLNLKTKNAHWNVEGPDFYTMHKFFKEQYSQIDFIIDSVAERIRYIGHYTPATMKLYLNLTHFTEQTSQPNSSHGFVSELLTDHESIILILRKNLKTLERSSSDLGTNDFIVNLIAKHEKMAWFLRSHLIAN